MKKKEIGNMIRTLRDGKSSVCPKCTQGIIEPKKKDDNYFKCDSCDFTIHLNKI